MTHFWPCPTADILWYFFRSMYAFSAFNNAQLQFLWDWSQHNLTIHAGNLFFGRNPHLCVSEIRKMWLKTGIKKKFVEEEFSKNGGHADCECLN